MSNFKGKPHGPIKTKKAPTGPNRLTALHPRLKAERRRLWNDKVWQPLMAAQRNR